MAASQALDVAGALRDIADDVAYWDVERVAPKEIDRRIDAWARGHGFDYDEWLADLQKEQPGVIESTGADPRKVWELMGFREWVRECVRSIAFTDEPIPFMPFAAGFWYRMPEADPPVLIAYMTPLSDPDLAAKQLKKQFRETFGPKGGRETRANEVENARIMRMHRDGMSYGEIAIQTLRRRYPDIIEHPHKYRAERKREKERVAKAVRAAEAVWKERLGESSTDE
ncbi:MAG: hypothetical protein FDZ75_01860 [Actinobacteria bacterium]|nr:MAG: hypothetical protein FDZ75_01860 [Actinomycetota bacterium]